ncbi:hypothetical protein AURDEDRAFT_122304 [Auricularia subglabra TFB-10046 SS5]|nr:hypothetical protein AURDEDRAFT_122304 [Auricularia subglabra TFB-10046 SS5]
MCRGFYAYRYRRRYYTTFFPSDPYPSSLGEELVAIIPTNPTRFQRWVDKTKRRLDEQYDAARPVMLMLNLSGAQPGSVPPYSMRAPLLDRTIAFTYVLDLDRNAFTVNEVMHLRLDAIPRGEGGVQWMSALSDPEHPARIASLSPTVPGPDPRYLALYEASGASQSLSLPSDVYHFAFPMCGVLMDYFFRQLRFVYSPVLDSIEQYEHFALDDLSQPDVTYRQYLTDG